MKRGVFIRFYFLTNTVKVHFLLALLFLFSPLLYAGVSINPENSKQADSTDIIIFISDGVQTNLPEAITNSVDVKFCFQKPAPKEGKDSGTKNEKKHLEKKSTVKYVPDVCSRPKPSKKEEYVERSALLKLLFNKHRSNSGFSIGESIIFSSVIPFNLFQVGIEQSEKKISLDFLDDAKSILIIISHEKSFIDCKLEFPFISRSPPSLLGFT